MPSLRICLSLLAALGGLKAEPLPRQALRPGMVFVLAKESPTHPALWIQQTEVTRAAWRSVMGTEPWKEHETSPRPGDDLPIAFVSWHEVQTFIRRLNDLDPYFAYRLPTEAEWEEACRAGSAEDPTNLGQVAWFDENAFLGGEKFTHAVATKAPNAWGLHDTLGNLWEWTQDPRKDQERIIKGGSWRTSRTVTCVSTQNWLEADQRAGDLGFRLVATPVEDGLWSDWTPLPAGGRTIHWRMRWVGPARAGHSSWCFQVMSQETAPVRITLYCGHSGDDPPVELTLEPDRHHEFQAEVIRSAKGQRPHLSCVAVTTLPAQA